VGYRRRFSGIGSLAVASAVSLLLSACSPGESRSLEGSWEVRELVSEDSAGGPSDGLTMILEGGEAYGFSGCNTYTFRYQTEGESIEVGDVVVTRLACKQEGVMDTERAFLLALTETSSWNISGSSLTFSGVDSSVAFVPLMGEG